MMMMLTYAPNTAMILGAALSGGDAMGLAQRIADGLGDNDERADDQDEGSGERAGPAA